MFDSWGIFGRSKCRCFVHLRSELHGVDVFYLPLDLAWSPGKIAGDQFPAEDEDELTPAQVPQFDEREHVNEKQFV